MDDQNASGDNVSFQVIVTCMQTVLFANFRSKFFQISSNTLDLNQNDLLLKALMINLLKPAKIRWELTTNRGLQVDSLPSEQKITYHKFDNPIQPLICPIPYDNEVITISVFTESTFSSKMSKLIGTTTIAKAEFKQKHAPTSPLFFSSPISNNASFRLEYEIHGPSLLCYQMEHESMEEALTEFLELLKDNKAASKASDYISFKPLREQLFEITELYITKPILIETVTNILPEVWKELSGLSRAATRFLEVEPNVTQRIFGIIEKDKKFQHASQYKLIFDILKPMSVRNGGSNLIPNFCDLLEKSVTSIDSPSCQTLAQYCLFALAYFDPKYNSYIVNKTKVPELLTSILKASNTSSYSLGLYSQLFSFIKHIGIDFKPQLEAYSILTMIHDLSFDTPATASLRSSQLAILEQFKYDGTHYTISNLLILFEQDQHAFQRVKIVEIIRSIVQTGVTQEEKVQIITKLLPWIIQPVDLVLNTLIETLTMLKPSMADFFQSGFWTVYASYWQSKSTHVLTLQYFAIILSNMLAECLKNAESMQMFLDSVSSQQILSIISRNLDIKQSLEGKGVSLLIWMYIYRSKPQLKESGKPLLESLKRAVSSSQWDLKSTGDQCTMVQLTLVSLIGTLESLQDPNVDESTKRRCEVWALSTLNQHKKLLTQSERMVSTSIEDLAAGFKYNNELVDVLKSFYPDLLNDLIKSVAGLFGSVNSSDRLNLSLEISSIICESYITSAGFANIVKLLLRMPISPSWKPLNSSVYSPSADPRKLISKIMIQLEKDCQIEDQLDSFSLEELKRLSGLLTFVVESHFVKRPLESIQQIWAKKVFFEEEETRSRPQSQAATEEFDHDIKADEGAAEVERMDAPKPAADLSPIPDYMLCPELDLDISIQELSVIFSLLSRCATSWSKRGNTRLRTSIEETLPPLYTPWYESIDFTLFISYSPILKTINNASWLKVALIKELVAMDLEKDVWPNAPRLSPSLIMESFEVQLLELFDSPTYPVPHLIHAFATSASNTKAVLLKAIKERGWDTLLAWTLRISWLLLYVSNYGFLLSRDTDGGSADFVNQTDRLEFFSPGAISSALSELKKFKYTIRPDTTQLANASDFNYVTCLLDSNVSTGAPAMQNPPPVTELPYFDWFERVECLEALLELLTISIDDFDMEHAARPILTPGRPVSLYWTQFGIEASNIPTPQQRTSISSTIARVAQEAIVAISRVAVFPSTSICHKAIRYLQSFWRRLPTFGTIDQRRRNIKRWCGANPEDPRLNQFCNAPFNLSVTSPSMFYPKHFHSITFFHYNNPELISDVILSLAPLLDDSAFALGYELTFQACILIHRYIKELHELEDDPLEWEMANILSTISPPQDASSSAVDPAACEVSPTPNQISIRSTEIKGSFRMPSSMIWSKSREFGETELLYWFIRKERATGDGNDDYPTTRDHSNNSAPLHGDSIYHAPYDIPSLLQRERYFWELSAIWYSDRPFIGMLDEGVSVPMDRIQARENLEKRVTGYISRFHSALEKLANSLDILLKGGSAMRQFSPPLSPMESGLYLKKKFKYFYSSSCVRGWNFTDSMMANCVPLPLYELCSYIFYWCTQYLESNLTQSSKDDSSGKSQEPPDTIAIEAQESDHDRKNFASLEDSNDTNQPQQSNTNGEELIKENSMTLKQQTDSQPVLELSDPVVPMLHNKGNWLKNPSNQSFCWKILGVLSDRGVSPASVRLCSGKILEALLHVCSQETIDMNSSLWSDTVLTSVVRNAPVMSRRETLFGNRVNSNASITASSSESIQQGNSDTITTNKDSSTFLKYGQIRITALMDWAMKQLKNVTTELECLLQIPPDISISSPRDLSNEILSQFADEERKKRKKSARLGMARMGSSSDEDSSSLEGSDSLNDNQTMAAKETQSPTQYTIPTLVDFLEVESKVERAEKLINKMHNFLNIIKSTIPLELRYFVDTYITESPTPASYKSAENNSSLSTQNVSKKSKSSSKSPLSKSLEKARKESSPGKKKNKLKQSTSSLPPNVEIPVEADKNRINKTSSQSSFPTESNASSSEQPSASKMPDTLFTLRQYAQFLLRLSRHDQSKKDWRAALHLSEGPLSQKLCGILSMFVSNSDEALKLFEDPVWSRYIIDNIRAPQTGRFNSFPIALASTIAKHIANPEKVENPTLKEFSQAILSLLPDMKFMVFPKIAVCCTRIVITMFTYCPRLQAYRDKGLTAFANFATTNAVLVNALAEMVGDSCSSNTGVETSTLRAKASMILGWRFKYGALACWPKSFSMYSETSSASPSSFSNQLSNVKESANKSSLSSSSKDLLPATSDTSTSSGATAEKTSNSAQSIPYGELIYVPFNKKVHIPPQRMPNMEGWIGPITSMDSNVPGDLVVLASVHGILKLPDSAPNLAKKMGWYLLHSFRHLNGLDPNFTLPPFIKSNGFVYGMNSKSAPKQGYMLRVMPFNAMTHIWYSNVSFQHAAPTSSTSLFSPEINKIAKCHFVFPNAMSGVSVYVRVGWATMPAIQRLQEDPFLMVGDVEGSFGISYYESSLFSEGRSIPITSFTGNAVGLTYGSDLYAAMTDHFIVFHGPLVQSRNSLKMLNEGSFIIPIGGNSGTSNTGDETFYPVVSCFGNAEYAMSPGW